MQVELTVVTIVMTCDIATLIPPAGSLSSYVL
jgi:hypothetical protein